MSWPTVMCEAQNLTYNPPAGAETPFNQVWFYFDYFGLSVPLAYADCQADTAALVPVEQNVTNLSSDEFSELWPLIFLMMVTAYGIRLVLGMFNPWR